MIEKTDFDVLNDFIEEWIIIQDFSEAFKSDIGQYIRSFIGKISLDKDQIFPDGPKKDVVRDLKHNMHLLFNYLRIEQTRANTYHKDEDLKSINKLAEYAIHFLLEYQKKLDFIWRISTDERVHIKDSKENTSIISIVKQEEKSKKSDQVNESTVLRAFTFLVFSEGSNIKDSYIELNEDLKNIKDLNSKLRRHYSKWKTDDVSDLLRESTQEYIESHIYLGKKDLNCIR